MDFNEMKKIKRYTIVQSWALNLITQIQVDFKLDFDEDRYFRMIDMLCSYVFNSKKIENLEDTFLYDLQKNNEEQLEIVKQVVFKNALYFYLRKEKGIIENLSYKKVVELSDKFLIKFLEKRK